MVRRADGLLGQIATLMWKNRLLKQRHYIATAFEIVIPVIMVLLFSWFKTLQPNEAIPAGWTVRSTNMSLFAASYNMLGSTFGLSLPYQSPVFGFTEVSMSGFLLGLSHLAWDDFLSNSTASLEPTDSITCQTKFLRFGYTSSTPTSPLFVPVECRGQVIPYRIAVAPKNHFTQNYFSATMEAWYPAIPLTNHSIPTYGNDTPIIPAWKDAVMFFDTADDLQAYVGGTTYGTDVTHPKIYAAIVFNTFPTDAQIGTATPIDYTLRLKSTQGQGGVMGDVPHTDKNTQAFVNPLAKNLNQQYYGRYVQHGTVTLQTLVTRFLGCLPTWNPTAMTTDGTCQQVKSTAVATTAVATTLFSQLLRDGVLTDALDQLAGDAQLGLNLNVTSLAQQLPLASKMALMRPLLQAPQAYAGAITYPFPIQAYISAPFYSMVSSVFPLVFILAYLLAVSRVIVVLVQEKETRSRELMKILGMGESAILLSWYLTYFIIFLVSSILAGIAGTLLFPNTNGGYLFILFFFFCASILAYGYLISAIFSNSKTAAMVGCSVFFIMYFISSAVSSAAEGGKMAVSILSPCAFAFCIQTLANVEGVSTGITAANANSLYGNFRFQGGLGMLIFDFVLYTLLGLYLQQVLPQEYGTPRKWYFPFQPSYWVGTGASAKVLDKVADAEPDTANVEPVSAELKAQEDDGRALKIRGIVKTFQTPMGITKVAVNGVTLTMYQDQITCLLGHNGAGKTTLISILTGMASTSQGNAFFGGHSILTDMDKIRQSLGMCPQHDVLYADMTVEEHLLFYGKIKGYHGKELTDVVSSKIKEVGLTEKRRVMSVALSGGMKRKLSVAIALLGDSHLVFLDEPTSGMDPYSRRSTWELILNNRLNRVIVLTTHFMDEADILGDRIAIMAEGKLRCCGSSLYLKNKYGAGYTLTIVKTSTATAGDEAKLVSFIQSHIPTATVLSNVGSEMSFQLSIESAHVFPSMFEALESPSTQAELQVTSFGVSVTTLEEVFIKVAEIGDEDGQHTLDKTKAPQQKAAPSYSVQNVQVSALAAFGGQLYALVQKRFRVARRDKMVILFSTILPIIMLYIGLSSLAHSSILNNDPSIALTPAAQYANGKNTPAPYVCAVDDGGLCTQWAAQIQRASATAIPLATPDPALTVFGTKYSQNMPMIKQFYGPYADTCLLTGEKLWLRGYNDQVDGQYGGYVLYGSMTDQMMSYDLFVNTTATHATVVYKAILDEAMIQVVGGTTNPVTVNLYPFPILATTKALFGAALSFAACLFISIAMTFFPASIVVFLVKEKQNECNAKHQQLVSGVSLTAFWLANFVFDILLYMVPLAAALLMIKGFAIQALTGPSDCTTCAIDTPAAVGVLFFVFGLAIIPFTYCLSYIFKQASTSQMYTLLINMVLGLILMIVSFVLDLFDSTKDINASLIYIWRLSPLFCLSNGLLRLSLHSLLANRAVGGGTSAPVSAFSNDVMGKEITYLIVLSFCYFFCAAGIDFALSFPKIKAFFVRDPQLPLPAHDVDEDVAAETARVLDGKAEGDMLIIRKLKKVYQGNKIAVREISFGLHKGECFGYLGVRCDHLRPVSHINGAGKTTTMKMLTGDILPTSGGATLGGFDILTQQLQVRRLVGYCPQFDALFDLLSVREHLELFARIKGVPGKDVEMVVKEKMRQMNLNSFEHKLAGTLSGGNKRKLSVAIAMIGSPPIIFLDEPSTGMDPVSRRFMWDVIADISTTQKESTIVLTTHSMEECEALCTRVGIMVGGRLRCLGSVQHLKNRFGDGFLLHAKVDLPSVDGIQAFFDSDVKAHVSSVHADLSKDEGIALCAKLGAKDRSDWLSPQHATGYALAAVWDNTGKLPASTFCAWWLGETRFLHLQAFLTETFGNVSLLERQNEHCRFKLHEHADAPLRLSSVFARMEASKDSLFMKEYSVSQTTLEQIFNSFAKQQDEEKIVARGVETKSA
ncbi:Aste57867_2007 [Aphanomyces stellatus]|uniref:Aste57867_2007 protein n=1 Tax=Aphanomyces stellatus TaxID=120398 RepID=A0A485K752_9STRA|nr:hypothetical protein As57867_002005 [Aphanomyces stellatus]VFT79211.1 Aste57867_2007 [Aphanomyces stellatus]